MNPPSPLPGQLWAVAGPARHAVYLGGDVWSILICRHDEYSLEQAVGLTPVSPAAKQPAGSHWADQFDALAERHGLNTSWHQEVNSYMAAGLSRVLPRR